MSRTAPLGKEVPASSLFRPWWATCLQAAHQGFFLGFKGNRFCNGDGEEEAREAPEGKGAEPPGLGIHGSPLNIGSEQDLATRPRSTSHSEGGTAGLSCTSRCSREREFPLVAGHPELTQHFSLEEKHPKGCWVIDLLLEKEQRHECSTS
jgi:hypothetical protein